MPVTAGLVMASAALLIRAHRSEWAQRPSPSSATLLFLFTRLHPLLVLAAAAALGATGLLA